MNKPPYTITEKAADHLAKIVETVTRLELGTGFKRDIRLHRENRLRTIHSSLAIEGNELSLGEVTAVLQGKRVAGKQEDIKEVKNAYAAYDKILTFDPYSITDFLKAHQLMTGGLLTESGQFRSSNVGVFDGDMPVHIGARPQFVSQLMDDLFRWAKASDLHSVLKSAIVHYEIEIIHPFADGNGRMGRLWQTLMLSKWNVLFAWIPMESVIYQKRPEYYRVIADASRAGDSGIFIEFTLAAVLESINEQERQQQDVPKNVPENVPENQLSGKILALLMSNPKTSAQKLAATLGVTDKTIKRHIKVLVEQGYLQRIGPAKGGHWQVINPKP